MKLSRSENITVVDSAGTETVVINSTGSIVVANPVQVVSTTTATITASGITVLEGTAARAYTLVAAPQAGVYKTIINKSSTAAVTIDLGVVIAFSTATATDTQHIITFTTHAGASSVQLVGITTALWGIVGSQGGITVSS